MRYILNAAAARITGKPRKVVSNNSATTNKQLLANMAASDAESFLNMQSRALCKLFRSCFRVVWSCFKQLANNFRQRSVALPSDRHKRRDEVPVDVGAIDDAVVGNDGGLLQVLVCKNSRDAAEVVVDVHRDDVLRRN